MPGSLPLLSSAPSILVMVRAVLSSIMMALVYASVGLAPLVYTYVAARESRREYEKRVEEAVREPIVPVHVIVVVKEDDVEVEMVDASVNPVEHAVDVATSGGEEGVVVPLAALGPRLEGVQAPSSIGGIESAALET